MHRLAIGTAQWGLDYGATNPDGRVSDSTLRYLIQTLSAAGIHELDTAAGYGDSEQRIGTLQIAQFEVQTKVTGKGKTAEEVMDSINQSVSRLNRTHLDSVLVHDWFELSDHERRQVSNSLTLAVDSGLARKVGISAYTLEDIKSAQLIIPNLKRAQIPLNILDQRFIHSGENFPDIEFQARSIFLQGLLLSHDHMNQHPDLKAVASRASDLEIPLLELALLFIHQLNWLDLILVAPTSSHELHQILDALNRVESMPEINFEALASEDMSLIDPRTWNQ
ncbi:MAG: aldo/keto reductase [Candidatus Nanopelagicales bacterium]